MERRVIAGLLITVALAGCGGSDGDRKQSHHTVTATASPGGTVTPASTAVRAGAVTHFTLTPDDGFVVASVTGCSGQFTGGGTFMTGPVSAPCSVAVSFAPADGEVKLAIDHAYITQAIQTLDGSVPLIAGRDGLLRVFVTADRTGARPDVRVEFFHDGQLVDTTSIMAPGPAPIVVDESRLGYSWNMHVPAALIQSGLAFRASIDGAGIFPPTGSPQPITVHELDPIRLRLIPVHFEELEAAIPPEHIPYHLNLLLRLMPIAAYEVEIGEPYTTTATTHDGKLATASVVAELRELRNAANVDANEYFVGIFKHVQDRADEGGRGYIGHPVSLSPMVLPVPATFAVPPLPNPRSGDTFAHELGHNFGLRHAPCGRVGTSHEGYPHDGGVIGAWGWDPATGALLRPQALDIMGYCRDGDVWISDFMYSNALEFRRIETVRRRGDPTSAAAPAMVIWGTVRDSGITLRPSYVDYSSAADAPGTGPYVAQGLDATGNVLFEKRFNGTPVSHSHGNHADFSIRIPLAAESARQLAAVRVHARGHSHEVPTTHAARVETDPGLVVSELAHGRVRVRWDAGKYPLAVIRSARTGTILSLATGGDVVVRADAGVDVSLSDGLHSHSIK